MKSVQRTNEGSSAPSVRFYHLCFTKLVKKKKMAKEPFSLHPLLSLQRIYLKYPHT